jgi:hypothetical protein
MANNKHSLDFGKKEKVLNYARPTERTQIFDVRLFRFALAENKKGRADFFSFR